MAEPQAKRKRSEPAKPEGPKPEVPDYEAKLRNCAVQMQQIDALYAADSANEDLAQCRSDLADALVLLQKAAGLDVDVRKQGKVQWFDQGKGFGVIDFAGDERGVFVHKSQIKCYLGEPVLEPGQWVSFVVVEDSSGKKTAEHVRGAYGEELAGFIAAKLDLHFATMTRTGRKQDNEDRSENFDLGPFGQFFGVYDGHSGSLCSEFVEKHLHRNIETACRPPSTMSAVEKAVVAGFQVTDKDFLKKAAAANWDDGSTASIIVVHGADPPTLGSTGNVALLSAHIGDCRAVLCRNGRAMALSEDHKPNRADEKRRIESVGGRVVDMGGIPRVASAAAVSRTESLLQQGVRVRPEGLPRCLAVSRSFGDKDLRPMVSAVPEMKTFDITADDAFFVIACDGVWDVLSNQDVVELVKPLFRTPAEAAQAVIDTAYNKLSGDNLTCTVVTFGWLHDSERLDSLLAPYVPPEQKASTSVTGPVDDIDDIFG